MTAGPVAVLLGAFFYWTGQRGLSGRPALADRCVDEPPSSVADSVEQ